MSVVVSTVLVTAPAVVVFDHARSVSVHVASMTRYGEHVVDAPASDLLGPGDEVTWRGRHFGRTWELTSRITRFDPPRYFQDTMVRGPFASLVHDHYFHERDDSTELTDVFSYTVGLGLLGAAADRAFVQRRIERILEGRAEAIRQAAES